MVSGSALVQRSLSECALPCSTPPAVQQGSSAGQRQRQRQPVRSLAQTLSLGPQGPSKRTADQPNRHVQRHRLPPTRGASAQHRMRLSPAPTPSDMRKGTSSELTKKLKKDVKCGDCWLWGCWLNEREQAEGRDARERPAKRAAANAGDGRKRTVGGRAVSKLAAPVGAQETAEVRAGAATVGSGSSVPQLHTAN